MDWYKMGYRFGEWVGDNLWWLLLVIFGIVFVWFIIYLAILDNRISKDKHNFQAACIDAGGYPVTPLGHVKGHGEGYLCVKEDGIIELKDEKK